MANYLANSVSHNLNVCMFDPKTNPPRILLLFANVICQQRPNLQAARSLYWALTKKTNARGVPWYDADKLVSYLELVNFY
jgi:hypothetical protein